MPTPIQSPAAHARWSEIPVEPMNPLLGRQFVNGEQLTIARITLRKGAHVPLHSHINEQAASVLSGCLQFLLHEQAESGTQNQKQIREVILRPGELLIIPPNVPHEVFTLEDTINLDIFSPTRHDWLTGDDAYLRTPSASNTP